MRYEKSGLVRTTPLLVLLYLLMGCEPVGKLGPVVTQVNQEVFVGPVVKVTSYNMLHPGPGSGGSATASERIRLLIDAIVAEKPDLVLLQEASDTRSYGNVVDQIRDDLNQQLAQDNISYNSVWLPANGDPTGITGFIEGEAILSRYAIDSADFYRYKEQSTTVIPETRKALLVSIKGAINNIDIVVVHLSTDNAFNNKQSAELIQMLNQNNGNSIIIAGDFNAVPEQDTMQYMVATGLIDVWQALYPDRQGFTSGTKDLTNPEFQLHRRIDYILVTPNTELRSIRQFMDRPIKNKSAEGNNETWLWGSDHIGLTAELTPAGY